jgi:hypothetical protein
MHLEPHQRQLLILTWERRWLLTTECRSGGAGGMWERSCHPGQRRALDLWGEEGRRSWHLQSRSVGCAGPLRRRSGPIRCLRVWLLQRLRCIKGDGLSYSASAFPIPDMPPLSRQKKGKRLSVSFPKISPLSNWHWGLQNFKYKVMLTIGVGVTYRLQSNHAGLQGGVRA